MTAQQKLIAKVTPDLPIKVYPKREILERLRKELEDDTIHVDTELEVHSMVDMANHGGIVCGIVPVGGNPADMKTAFLASITHFKVKKGEPHYKDLEKYRTKRIRKLIRENKRANSGRFF